MARARSLGHGRPASRIARARFVISLGLPVWMRGAAVPASYVDAKNGSNVTGDGTSGAPWQTIAFALTQTIEGDRLRLRGDSADPATYYRPIGTAVAKTNTIFEADPGDTPVLAGSVRYTTWAKTGGRTNVYETAYTPAACWFVFNGATRLTSVADVATCDATANSYYADLAGDKLYVNIGGAAPTSIEVIPTNNYGLTFNGAGNTLHDLTFWHWFQAGVNAAAALTVDTCHFNRHATWGGDQFAQLRIAAANVLVDGCDFVGCGGIKSDSAGPRGVSIGAVNNATIRDCTLSDASLGIVFAGSGTGHVISGCTISEMYDGINSYVAAAGSTIGATIRNNTLFNCSHGLMTLRYTVNGTIRHNIGYHTENQGGNGYGFIFHNGGACNAYHNTFDDLNLSGNGAGLYFAPLDANTLTIDARNNIFNNCDIGIRYVSGAVTYNVLDYNAFNGNGNDFDGIVVGDQGTHNVTDDPLFTNHATHDYTLQAGSPCIDKGVEIAGINEDHLGAAPDIGRFEKA